MEIILTTKEDLKNIIKTTLETIINQQHKKENEKKLLTFNETVKFLGVSESTLHNWKSSGKIPFKRIGKRIYFDKDEILKAPEPDRHFNRMRKLERGEV